MSSSSTSSSEVYTSKQKLDEDNHPVTSRLPAMMHRSPDERIQNRSRISPKTRSRLDTRRSKHELDRDGITTQLATAFEALLAQSKVDHISKCLCTSLGSFTSEKYAKNDGQPNRPMYQLVAFEVMKRTLGKLLQNLAGRQPGSPC